MSETDQKGEPSEEPTEVDGAEDDSTALIRALQSRSESGRERRGLLGESPASSTGQRVGHYELGPEIARGGIGIVLRGRDLDLGRDVALKVLRPECADSTALVERFVEEAQIGGQLQHPGIVPVYDLGVQADQRPYFAMKLIEGRTLAELLAERRDPGQGVRRFLAIFERICETVAYAHARGVVHRDLKPANVMVGAFGEVQVVDWGLAKVLGSARGAARDAALDKGHSAAPRVTTVRTTPDQESSASIAGSALGTPASMPPEQARGDHDRVLETADVFALGAILLEILTGKGPYADAESALVAAADCETGPALERVRASGADEALIDLCTRCLSAAPEDRPANASVLAQEVAQYLAAAEEHAQQARIKAAEERRARRSTMILSAVIGTVILIGAAVSWRLQSARADRQSRTQAAVAEALDEVALHRGRAVARDDLASWDATFAAFQLARTAAESGEADSKTHDRLDALEGELIGEREQTLLALQEEQRDQRLLDRLAATRELSDPRLAEMDFREQWLRDSFLEYGLDFVNQDVDALCAAVSDCPIGVELARGLDEWARFRRIQEMYPASRGRFSEPSVEKLLVVAQAADPEEFRNQLRDALLAGPAAVVEYSRAADLDALPPEVLSLLSVWMVTTARSDAAYAEAARLLERGVQRHPGDFGLRFGLAEHLSSPAHRDWVGALPHYRVAHALQPGNLMLRDKLGTALLVGRRYAEAADLAEGTLRAAPGHAPAQVLLGVARLGDGRLEEAVEPLRAGVEAVGDLSAWMQLADTLSALGRTEEAEVEYRRLLERERSYTAARLRYAQMLMMDGRGEDALTQLQQADRFEPTSLDAVAGHAQGLFNLGRYAEAARVFRRALLLDPSRSSVNIGLSYCLMRSGQQQQAIEEAELTARQHQGESSILASAMLSLFYVGEVDRAVELGESSLGRFPGDPVLASWLAYLWLFRGDGEADPGRALQLARDAVEVVEAIADPAAREQLLANHPYIHATLGAAWMREGDPALALRAFERRPPPVGSFQSSAFLLLQAMAHADCDEPEQAQACYRDAVAWAVEFDRLFGSLPLEDVLPEYRRTLAEAREHLGVE